MQTLTKKSSSGKLIPNKIDFRAKKITKNREEYWIKGSLCQEDKAILNVYASNKRATKHAKQKLTELNRETYRYTILVEDFTPLQQRTRQKNSKIIE